MRTIVSAVFFLTIALSAGAQPVSWDAIGKILGQKGTVRGGMFKVAYPRTDLDVRIGDVQIDARAGMTSWIGFETNEHTAVMGDLVLKVDEVMPVIQKLMDEKIEVTALHNQLMGASVPIMCLHFMGKGDAKKLATALRNALALTGTPLTPAPRPPETVPPEFSVVQYFLGPGTVTGSVLKYNFSRNQIIIEDDREIPGFLGTATALNFQVVNGRAAATGDFVLTADEVNPVIKALADSNITVTAVHNDMLDEIPRLFFVHFWSYDTPQAVGAGLRNALDEINIRRENE